LSTDATVTNSPADVADIGPRELLSTIGIAKNPPKAAPSASRPSPVGMSVDVRHSGQHCAPSRSGEGIHDASSIEHRLRACAVLPPSAKTCRSLRPLRSRAHIWRAWATSWGKSKCGISSFGMLSNPRMGLSDYELAQLRNSFESAVVLYRNIPVDILFRSTSRLSPCNLRSSRKTARQLERGFADLTTACNNVIRRRKLGLFLFKPQHLPRLAIKTSCLPKNSAAGSDRVTNLIRPSLLCFWQEQ